MAGTRHWLQFYLEGPSGFSEGTLPRALDFAERRVLFFHVRFRIRCVFSPVGFKMFKGNLSLQEMCLVLPGDLSKLSIPKSFSCDSSLDKSCDVQPA